ncbi:MAG: C40 family peptidase [Bacteroidia bacterium]|nr:C40 family peptidase [Bacteroidia bacterium]
MEYGISNISIIPVRSEPSEKSEMVTQILFGEHFAITEYGKKWCRVKLYYDDYEGFVDTKMILRLQESYFTEISAHSPSVTSDILTTIYEGGGKIPLYITAGSSLPFLNRPEKTFRITNINYRLDSFTDISSTDIRKNITDIAMKYLNAPYLWGGRTIFGIDCSGFVQMVYKICGVKMPRDTAQQVNSGKTLNFIAEAKPGDLAFFDDEEGLIVHVGIILGKEKIIHASGKVRIDRLDHQGIYNPVIKNYTHKLRVLRTYLE